MCKLDARQTPALGLSVDPVRPTACRPGESAPRPHIAVLHGAGPIVTRCRRIVQAPLPVRPGQEVMVIDLACPIRVMIGYPIFVGQIVDDGYIGVRRSCVLQVSNARGNSASRPIVPRPSTHPVDGILRRSTEKRAPLFVGRARSGILCDPLAKRIGACEASEVTSEPQRVVRFPLQRFEAGNEEAEQLLEDSRRKMVSDL